MCRRNSVRWYVESKDGLRVLVEDPNIGLYFSPKVFEPEPKLFNRVKKARQAAHDNDAIVKHYDKPKYDLSAELPF